MSVIDFQGGNLDGQSGYYEGFGGGAPAPEAAPVAAEEPGAGGGQEDESAIFRRMLEDARSLLAADSLSEANKLLMEQATTLIQKIRASEEKEMDDAMSGKLSPGVLRKAGAAGGGY